eukprot:5258499-Amphidinium_carterae.1
MDNSQVNAVSGQKLRNSSRVALNAPLSIFGPRVLRFIELSRLQGASDSTSGHCHYSACAKICATSAATTVC